jgi:hypothetical protein
LCFQIKATEVNNETRSGEAEVNIKLKDINDEAPEFVTNDFTFTVQEHAPAGTVLGSVQAVDLDSNDIIR